MISVIIPTYNAAGSLGACLDALKHQSYAGKREIIVVDDGSTDGTAAVLKGRRMTVLRRSNQGPAAARNAGARKAKGNIILFLDADCVPHRDWLKEMLMPFADPQVAGVQGAYRTRQKELVARFAQLEIEQRYQRMAARRIDFVGSYAAAYRRDIFLEQKGFYEGFRRASGEDSDLSFRIADAGHHLVFAPKAIVYHLHPASLGHYLRQKYSRAYWRTLLYRRHPKKMASESYTPQLLKVQLGLFPLVVLFLLASLLGAVPTLGWIALVLYLIAIAPETARNVQKDVSVGIASLGILPLRSAVFALGLAAGTIGNRSATS